MKIHTLLTISLFSFILLTNCIESSSSNGSTTGSSNGGTNSVNCSDTLEDCRTDVISQTNTARSQETDCGTEGIMDATDSLTENSLLNQAAQNHADDMAANEFLSHTGSNGSSVADRVFDTGYSALFAGENAAFGVNTPDDVIDLWLGSAGHCQNIMRSIFTEIGVGYATASDGVGYWVQVFATPTE